MNVVTVGPGLRRTTYKLGEIELEVHEGGKGPPLLFLHGGSGLDPAAPFLALLSRTFHVIAPSHPGFGGSSLPIWIDSVEDFAHVHLELIGRMKLAGVTLVGHSVGGWTAAEMATKSTAAIDKLVLMAPVGIKVGPVDRLDIPDIYAMAQDKLDALLYADPEKARPDITTMTDAQLLTRARNRQTLALVTWEPYMHNPKLKHRLHTIDRPTLLIRGAQDGLVSKDYAAAYAGLIPGAQRITIEGAGHSPQLEQPQRFVEEIERFAGVKR
ncbi:MAG: alpha/beta fold hydrolase [Bradyrhizobium sp.]